MKTLDVLISDFEKEGYKKNIFFGFENVKKVEFRFIECYESAIGRLIIPYFAFIELKNNDKCLLMVLLKILKKNILI